MDTIQLIGSTLGLSFAAGMRLYATVFALGLAVRFHLLHAGVMGGRLDVLAHPAILTTAGVACLVEFVADKVPWVDSVWDTFHTVVRPVGAAILAYAVVGHIDPVFKLTLILLCGGVAFASHSSKMATRLAVNHSPEPVTNIVVSLLEEAAIPVWIWLSVTHPLVGLTLVVVFLGLFAWLGPRVWRGVRLPLVAVRAWMSKGQRVQRQSAAGAGLAAAGEAGVLPGGLGAAADTEASTLPEGLRALGLVLAGGVAVPLAYARAAGIEGAEGLRGVRVAAAENIGRLRHSIGYLVLSGGALVFVTRRAFRYRVHRIPLGEVTAVQWRRGLLMNRLVLKTAGGDKVLYVFKDVGMA